MKEGEGGEGGAWEMDSIVEKANHFLGSVPIPGGFNTRFFLRIVT